jgi:hypothetical protein
MAKVSVLTGVTFVWERTRHVLPEEKQKRGRRGYKCSLFFSRANILVIKQKARKKTEKFISGSLPTIPA